MKINTSKNGFALLLVLIAIAIIMVMMATQMKTLFGPGLPSEPIGPEERPWLLDKHLVPAEEGIKMPNSPKPELNESLTIHGTVTRNDAPRGTAQVIFETDGRVEASWTCRYSYDEETYTITTEEMLGNIVVKEIFEDENGKDKSRLFFVTKGKYSKKSGQVTPDTIVEKGTVYVHGWLSPDRSVTGHVSISQKKDWGAAYEFTAPPQ